jgi:hypothetical protein
MNCNCRQTQFVTGLSQSPTRGIGGYGLPILPDRYASSNPSSIDSLGFWSELFGYVGSAAKWVLPVFAPIAVAVVPALINKATGPTKTTTTTTAPLSPSTIPVVFVDHQAVASQAKEAELESSRTIFYGVLAVSALIIYASNKRK